MKNRNDSVDVLRWLALTGIIIVHSEPSVFWQQIRSFDVPLMVIISAFCFASGKRVLNKKQYYFKRFVRLVVPTWIFLFFYYFVSYLFGENIEMTTVISRFSLITSWYLWIVRILFVMALIAPFLLSLSESMPPKHIIMACIALLVITELLSSVSDNYYYIVFIMFFPYIVYYILGINIKQVSEKIILKFGVASLLAYVIIAIFLSYSNNEYVLTGQYKYPPQIYYSSYALGMSAVLWYYKDRMVSFLEKIRLRQFAVFVGSHTFWIYLWHIPIVDYMIRRYDSFICFVTAYFLPIIIVVIQTMFVKTSSSLIKNQTVSKYLKMIFIG